ncbi:MAG: hypothetical protein IKL53_00015 [Lachnospiraceae bacterium]|nr:hypothetical protein [Lachnospiraceae bacterium]MBR3598244.1 hypothetical protein [Lachnospiraceae bacterium]
MNNTTKGQYELARKMLKGHIDIEEVMLMSGLSKEVLEQLNEEINPSNSEAQILKDLDTVDLNIGEILFDNLPAEDEGEGFHN